MTLRDGPTLRDGRTLGVLIVALALLAGVGVGLTSAGGVALTSATTPMTGVLPIEIAPSHDSTAHDQQTMVDSCVTIKQPGEYVLTVDIEQAGQTAISQPCIEILADDVTFDGNGHTIDGHGISHTKGVAVVGAEGVTVTNFSVNDWHSGVLVENGSATVRDVHTFSNAYGVRFENATESTVANSTVENNLIGIFTDGSDVTVENVTFSENEIRVKGGGLSYSS